MEPKHFLLLIGTMTLAACQGMSPAMSNHPSIGYVSATPSNDVEEYISAWQEAQVEMADEVQQATSSSNAVVPTQLPQQADLTATELWAKPLTSSGQGVTLAQEDNRRRLNDALETTPLGGTAKWESATLQFLFLPNSPVYTPHQSGGRCRDGVFAVYGDGFNDQRLRGLFCQTGPGADWLLKMHAGE